MTEKQAELRLDLSHVPGFFIRAVAAPFMLGEAKYSRGDWKNAVKNAEEAKEAINRRTTSLLNHLTNYLDGNLYDVEGCHELACVAWNSLYILFLGCRFLAWKPFLHDVLSDAIEGHKAKKGGV